MKLLKTSLLLAAAAATTHLDAAVYSLQWSGTSFGNSAVATGTIDLHVSTMPNPVNTGGSLPSWVNSLNVTVSGASSGNGSFTTADFGSIIFNSQGFTLNLNAELVGQNGGLFTGMSGDFNIFRAAGTPTAPNGTSPNVLRAGGGFSGDQMRLISFSLGGPSGVTDFADWMSSVNNQSRVYAAGTTLASLPLEGAHHRPMMSFDRMGKDAQFWATGDFGSSSRVRDVKAVSYTHLTLPTIYSV